MFDTTLTMSPRSARVWPAQHRPVVSQLSGRHAARDGSEAGSVRPHSAHQAPALSDTRIHEQAGAPSTVGPVQSGAGPTEDGPAPASPNIRNNRPGLEREGGGGGAAFSLQERRTGEAETEDTETSEHYQGGHETGSASGPQPWSPPPAIRRCQCQCGALASGGACAGPGAGCYGQVMSSGQHPAAWPGNS